MYPELSDKIKTDERLANELATANRRASKCRGWDIFPGEAKVSLLIKEISWMIHTLKGKDNFKEKREANEELLSLIIDDVRLSAAVIYPYDKY